MPDSDKSSPEVSGRCLGQSPDTCHVAIGRAEGTLLQTLWFNTFVHNGPYEPAIDKGTWYASYEKYGATLGGFIKSHACPKFLKGLREELGNG